MVAIALRRARRQPGRVSLLFLTIAMATALLTTTAGVYLSLTRSLDRLADFAAEADLEIAATTDQGFPEEVMFTVGDLDGVDVSAPLVRGEAALSGNAVTVVGLDAAAAELGAALVDEVEESVRGYRDRPGALLSGFFAGRPLADAAGLKVGERATLDGPMGPISLEVLGIVDGPLGHKVNRGFYVAALRSVAQDLAGHPERVDNVFVRFEEGANRDLLESQIEAIVSGRAIITEPGLRVNQARSDLNGVLLSLLLVALMAAAVSASLVYNVVGNDVAGRVRELSILRAVGASPVQLVASQTLVMSLLGGLAAASGSALGIGLAASVVENFPETTKGLTGVLPSFEGGMDLILGGVAFGVIVVLSAALPPIVRSARQATVGAIRETEGATNRPLWSLTGALILLASGALWFLEIRPIAAAGLAIIGVSATIWGIQPLVLNALAAVTKPWGASGRLAGDSLSRSPRRSIAALLGIVLSVALIWTIGAISATASSASLQTYEPYRDMDLIVQTTVEGGAPTDTVFSESFIEEVEALDDVASVSRSQFAYMTIGEDRIYVAGLEPDSNHPLIRLATASQQSSMFDGAGVIITRALAVNHELDVGDLLSIRLPSMHERHEVIGIVEIGVGAPKGAIVLPHSTLERWVARTGASRLELQTASGSDVEQLKTDIERLAAEEPYPTSVFTGDEQAESAAGLVAYTVALFSGARYVVTVTVAIAITTALMLAVLQRKREFAVLRSAGATRSHLRRSILAEASAILFVGFVVGLGLGMAMQAMTADIAPQLMGLTLGVELSLVEVALTLAGVGIPVLIGSAIPSMRAARTKILEGLAYD